jgi:lipooligosaccharide transport system ATP-binding protein
MLPEKDDRVPAAIEIQGLRKCYDHQVVVDGVDLTIPAGEFFGLLGPNGAGKTTTLRMLLGLTPIDAGTVHVLGRPMPECEREISTRLGVVPQFDTLDPDFTVEENLLTYASYFGLNRAALGSRVDELLEQANLENRRRSRISALSGGMKRRLTLARALINEPELVILDEPTTGLDPQARHHLWRQLRALRERGVTLVLTTHYMEEAEELCDRVAIIDAGRIIACASPAELIADPCRTLGDLAQCRIGSSLHRRSRHPARAHAGNRGHLADLHARDPGAVRAELDTAGLPHATRASNLEDVFLKLTGHDLRD